MPSSHHQNVEALTCLCIRADADERMGIGHVMRCLALAQEWRIRGGRVCLISALKTPALLARLKAEGVEFHPMTATPGGAEDLALTVAAARERGAAWLVLDGYHFSRGYMLGVQDSGLHLLLLDDVADRDLGGVEAVLNQNAYATPAMHDHFKPCPKLLLGTRYTLIRREFIAQREGRIVPADARHVLVTLGGADLPNATLLVLRALRMIATPGLEVKVVIGATNQHLASLQAELPALRCVHDAMLIINPPDMPMLMKWSDVTITAAGSTCWELCCLGVPQLVVETADNQRMMSPHLMKHGIAKVFGRLDEAGLEAFANQIAALLADEAERARLSQTASRLIDGKGASRVADFMLGDACVLPARR